MEKILLDTDVILDFFFDREPFVEFSAGVLSLCESKEIKGYITPVIISNVYYLLKRAATHRKVVGKLKLLVQIVDILSVDKEVCLSALDSDFRDFEDALQNYTALKSGKIDLILTRNLKDYKKSTIPVLTPEIYLKSRAI